MEENFVGKTTATDDTIAEITELGEINFGKKLEVNVATNRDEKKGDFNKNKFNAIKDISLNDNPILFVIKKNTSSLANIISYFQTRIPEGEEQLKEPLLLIDDECDHGSVNTNDPDGKTNPTKLNGQIRGLMAHFSRCAYVAYTATPFANIFINPENANLKFSELVTDSYESWIQHANGPIFSHQLLDKKIIPLTKEKKTLVLLLDNLRVDHWQTIKPVLEAQFNVVKDAFYTAILPTVTQYARNAIFSGLLPIEIKNNYPKQWKEDTEEGLKNEFEALFFKDYCERKNLKISHSYVKINHNKQATDYIKDFKKIAKNDLNFAVVGFIDQLSHAKTTHQIINDITHNNKAYRETTLNWFSNTYLQEILKLTIDHNIQLIITTDHGAIQVEHPSMLKGNRDHTDNLRYKNGHRINSSAKSSFQVDVPENIGLPKSSLASTYVFAKNKSFFVYPNEFNKFADKYRNSYQHGGISMEEMMVPFVVLVPK